jgi:uncharacterized protein
MALTCPACQHSLSAMTVGGVELDVCSGGCGGVWFGPFELRKFDEPMEAAGVELLDVPRSGEFVVDHEKRYSCPACADHAEMERHFFSVKHAVTVDECPECTGVWLDAGELRAIRDEFPDEAARRRAADAYFDEVFGGQLAAEHAESEEKLAKAHKFANVFRFICPSYYIPGEQKWGAF